MNPELIHSVNEGRIKWPQTCGGGVSDDAIADAENRLNVRFPEDYKEFLRYFGAGVIGGIGIFGLEMPEFMAGYMVTEATEKFRLQLEKDEVAGMVVLAVDGFGNPVGFLPGRSDVFHFNLETGVRMDVAKTFEGFLSKVIRGENLGF